MGISDPYNIAQSGYNDTVSAAAVVTGVGAGGTVASIAAALLGAGVYSVTVSAIATGGAPVAGDVMNMQLRRTASGLHTFMYPIWDAGGAPAAPINVIIPRVTLAATDTLNVIAIAAGTAAVSYFAAIYATRIA